MQNKRHLVIGLGEIGTALKNVLSSKYPNVEGIDADTTAEGKFDVLHICFPYSGKFVEYVKDYEKKYLKEHGLIIIHSTVPIGTTKKLKAVHSPCRGIHPNLEAGLKTFTKYFGGERANEAANIFFSLDIPCETIINSDNTESLKIWDTTIYGLNIILEKEIYRFCEENKLSFDFVYRDANTSYNQGYEKLGHPEYKKYVLRHMEGPIKGHCVLQNTELLDSWVARLIQEKNKEY